MWVVIAGQARRLPYLKVGPERLPYKFWPHPYKQKSSPNHFGEDFAKQRC